MGIKMDDTQLMKGILQGCVLGIISEGETYGYEILTELDNKGFHELGEGTLYPILTRLEKSEFIICRKEKSPLGPIRKYYSITVLGMKWLEEFKFMYQDITSKANEILFRKGEMLI